MEQLPIGIWRGDYESWLIIALLSAIVILLMTLVDISYQQKVVVIERKADVAVDTK